MNAITTTDPVSAQTLEHVLGTGDLSKLSTQQRVEFYAKTCQSLGLNPLTRPFRFMSFQGNTVMYATRDCADQLRKVNGITLHVVDKQLDDELFVVTVRARDKHGREDEDMGAVTIANLKGESRANALMKALTKAKRRVTLSICGLGLTDEAELDTMPGAYTFDADAEPDARDALNASVPMKQVPLTKAAAMPTTRAPRITEPAEQQPRKQTRREFLDALDIATRDAKSAQEADKLICSEEVMRAKEAFIGEAKDRLDKIIARTLATWFSDKPAEDADASHEPEEVA
jgi:hypothetical protein